MPDGAELSGGATGLRRVTLNSSWRAALRHVLHQARRAPSAGDKTRMGSRENAPERDRAPWVSTPAAPARSGVVIVKTTSSARSGPGTSILCRARRPGWPRWRRRSGLRARGHPRSWAPRTMRAGEGWVRGSPGGPDYRARRDPAIRRTGRSPSPAGGCGGGGSAHRGRTLDATTARQMVMVRETRRAFRRFRRTCFWSYRADLEIGADDVAWVAEQLMKHGHREAWRVGARLCR